MKTLPNSKFVAHWRRVGPILQKIRDDELRQFDWNADRHVVDGLLEMGVAHSPPKTTNGLVELQRLFRNRSRQLKGNLDARR